MKKEIKLILAIVMIITIFVFDNRIIAETLSKKEAISHNEIDFFRKQIGGNNAYSISGVNVTAPLSSSEEDGPTNCTAIAETQDNVCYANIINAAIGNASGDLVTDALWYTVESNLAAKDCGAAGDDIAVYNQTSGHKVTAKPTTLNFNRNGSNFVATFTLSGTNFSSMGNCTLSGVNGTIKSTEISNNSGTVTVTIPAANVTRDITATVTCPVNQTYKTTTLYSCGTGYQSLAVGVTQKNKSTNVTLSGSIEADKKGSITLIKRGKDSQGKTKSLKGVKFQIKNSKGKTINAKGEEESDYVFTTNASGSISVTDIELSNSSSENVYTIEEISTITGYERSTKKITVTLSKSDPTFTQTVTSNTIRVTISKTDKAGKKELPGAKLSIVDKKEKILNKCVIDKEKHLITFSDDEDAEACTWATTDKAYIFEGMPVGKYYLIEELAPEGYSKNKEKTLIEVKDTGAVKEKILMKNELKAPIPATLNARTVLLLTVAMFDISLGIGIMLYVKKSKD